MKNISRIIISGPSGSGKSTLINHLLNNYSFFRLSISHTTRKIRPGETDGKEYFFVTKDIFNQKIKNNEMFEWQIYNNQFYGTSYSELNNLSKITIFDLASVGVKAAFKCKLDAIYIYVYCSKDILRNRLTSRLNRIPNENDLMEIENRLVEYENDKRFFEDFNFDIRIMNDDKEKMLKDVIGFLEL